jgi:hypothetical protein
MSKLIVLGNVSQQTRAQFCKGRVRDNAKSDTCTSFKVYLKSINDPTQPYDPAPLT